MTIRNAVDVYLFPAVVGGGLGDIEEVLAAGRHLARDGHRPILFRTAGVPLPRSVEGPWDWPPLTRRGTLRPRARRALTITPSFGLSAAADTLGPLGRGGPWQREAVAVERAYGRPRTVHVSLEEFARTWPSRREARERYREGGRSAREIRALAQRPGFDREVHRWHDAYRRFRAFDRPDVVHLFGSFYPQSSFSQEFPEAVPCGPLWPHRYDRRSGLSTPRDPTWVWYASPASAERLLPAVLEGLAPVPSAPFLWIRSPRPWQRAPPRGRGRLQVTVASRARWRARFASAALRIVTGSRTLLEAIELGAPFLYFNGVLGEGPHRRRHRPDKIEALLRAADDRKVAPDLVRDLRDFSRGRRVGSAVYRAASREGGWARFPRGRWVNGFRPPYDDLGRLVVRMARVLAEGIDGPELVRAVRSREFR